MPTILSHTDLQKSPRKVAEQSQKGVAIVTSHGQPSMVILPYFPEGDALIEHYFEEFEIAKNRKKLIAELAVSKKSGVSDFFL